MNRLKTVNIVLDIINIVPNKLCQPGLNFFSISVNNLSAKISLKSLEFEQNEFEFCICQDLNFCLTCSIVNEEDPRFRCERSVQDFFFNDLAFHQCIKNKNGLNKIYDFN